jgi:hypothetical protein
MAKRPKQQQPEQPKQPERLRVWIELEPYRDAPERRERAMQLANRMMARLGAPEATFWWNERKGCYALTTSADGLYYDLLDRGHWFNLEYLGRPDDPAPAPEATPAGERKPDVIVTIEEGSVVDVTLPDGLVAEVRDYDTEGAGVDDGLVQGEDGRSYFRSCWPE